MLNSIIYQILKRYLFKYLGRFKILISINKYINLKTMWFDVFVNTFKSKVLVYKSYKFKNKKIKELINIKNVI